MVTPGEGHEDTRARIDMPDDDAMRRVIQTFAGTEARLVVTDEAGGRRSVEVSHESLIRHWEKLRAWVRPLLRRGAGDGQAPVCEPSTRIARI